MYVDELQVPPRVVDIVTEDADDNAALFWLVQLLDCEDGAGGAGCTIIPDCGTPMTDAAPIDLITDCTCVGSWIMDRSAADNPSLHVPLQTNVMRALEFGLLS